MPSLKGLHQQFKKKDFVRLAISVDYERVKPVQEFISKHRYTFSVLLDHECEALDVFEVKEIPTTGLVDKKRRMIEKAIGPRDWNSSEVFRLLDILIGNDK